ncbi:MAG: hypothetical protein V4466_11000 [Pseudomonadota bacterium]
MRIVKGVREVRRFMDMLEQSLRSLRVSTGAPALDGLEDNVWSRIRAARADAVLERRWRKGQMLAASFALVTGIAFGGAEAAALLRTQQPAAALPTTTLAPSELLEGRG